MMRKNLFGLKMMLKSAQKMKMKMTKQSIEVEKNRK